MEGTIPVEINHRHVCVGGEAGNTVNMNCMNSSLKRSLPGL